MFFYHFKGLTQASMYKRCLSSSDGYLSVVSFFGHTVHIIESVIWLTLYRYIKSKYVILEERIA